MLALVSLGVESVEPHSFIHASFANMTVDMTYSHDILPAMVIALFVSGITAAIFKNWVIGLWAVGLILLHELMDLLVGSTAALLLMANQSLSEVASALLDSPH